jgi:hypothetical protein
MQINPIRNLGPDRADRVSTDAQPDGYAGFLSGDLRLMLSAQTDAAGHTVVWGVLLPGVVLPKTPFAVLLCPSLLRAPDRRCHRGSRTGGAAGREQAITRG